MKSKMGLGETMFISWLFGLIIIILGFVASKQIGIMAWFLVAMASLLYFIRAYLPKDK